MATPKVKATQRKRGVRGGGSFNKATGLWAVRRTIGIKSRVFYGRTQAEARIKADTATGAWIPAATETLGAFLTEWLQRVRSKRSAGTFLKYSANVSKHIEPHMGAMKLTDITHRDIESWLALLARGNGHKALSGTTRSNVFATLQAAMADAVSRDMIQKNPCDRVEKPKKDTRKRNVYNREQVQTILDAVRGTQYGALFMLGLTCGCRIGEMLALTWADVDLTGGRVHLHGSVGSDADGNRGIGGMKSATSERTIDMPKLVLEEFTRLQDASSGNGYVWAGASMRMPVSDDVVRTAWKSMLHGLQLPPLNLHDMRHTAASLMLMDGVPVLAVSGILGHSSPVITYSLYAHYVPGDRVGASSMDRLFSS